MSTPPISIALFVIAAALGAVGQYLYRLGALRLHLSVRGTLTNWPLGAGIVCYIAVMVLFLAAYKRGGSLAVLYPVYASTFIFGALLAVYTEGFHISAVNALGMVCLVVGMALLGAGQQKGEGDNPSHAPSETPAAHKNAQPGPGDSHRRAEPSRAA